MEVVLLTLGLIIAFVVSLLRFRQMKRKFEPFTDQPVYSTPEYAQEMNAYVDKYHSNKRFKNHHH